MINPIIALNNPNKQRLNAALDPLRVATHFDVIYCKNLAVLNKLPWGEEYHRFFIGPSGVVSPEELATWLGQHASMRKPSGGVFVGFIGDVAEQEAYKDVIYGHFGFSEDIPKVVMINNPESFAINLAIPQYSSVQLMPCETLADLMKLPSGFYDHILIGGSDDITVAQLAEWMDAKIPKARQYQVNIIWMGGDFGFLEVHRRHL